MDGGLLKQSNGSHGDTDTFDTFYIGCEKFPVHDIVSVPVSGVMLSKIPPQTARNLSIFPFFLF